MEDDAQQVEHLLDEAIASYSAVEPLAGLEQRILAKTRTAKGPRRNWLPSAAIIGALAGAAVLAWLFVPVKHEAPAKIATTTLSKPIVALQPPQAVQRLKPKHRRPRAESLPKLAVFPTPLPLTPEERRLTAMVARDPEGAIKAFESLQARADEPIRIAPIEIPPLQTGGAQ